MAMHLVDCLKLAEAARRDRSLLTNHVGDVDKKLRKLLAESQLPATKQYPVVVGA
jgi:hypothetical protein